MGLPAHRTAFADLEKRSLVQHGETIVAAAARRPGVSADLGAVRAQVASYKRRADAAALDALLIDSAYLIRDFSTPRPGVASRSRGSRRGPLLRKGSV